MIDPNQRKVIEQIRSSSAIRIQIPEGCMTITVRNKRFSKDVAIALQSYINNQNQQL